MNFEKVLNRKNLYYILEPLVFIAALLVINYNFFRDDIGFLTSPFHPFWLIIMFLTPRQKFPYGFISALIVAGVYLVIAYIRACQPFFTFVTTAVNLKMPVLFTLIGYYLSLVREGFDHEVRVLAERNGELEKQLADIKDINTGISDEDRKNALKIFEASNTIKTVYQAASSLNTHNEEEMLKSAAQLVRKFTESGSFAIYKVAESSKLVLAEEYVDEKAEKSIPLIGNINDDPVLAETYSKGRVFTIVDVYDPARKHVTRSEVKMACPIKFKGTEEIYGLIAIYEMPFSNMNLETVNILELICEWMRDALDNSKLVSDIKARNIEDDLVLAYKYDYFKKRFAEENSRAQRYNFDLSVLLVKITNYDSIPGERRVETLRLLSLFLKTIVRDVDLVSRFKDENFLAALLPSTDEKGVMMLMKRIKQAFPAFLKSAALAPDAITLDFNYKIAYRKK